MAMDMNGPIKKNPKMAIASTKNSDVEGLTRSQLGLIGVSVMVANVVEKLNFEVRLLFFAFDF